MRGVCCYMCDAYEGISCVWATKRRCLSPTLKLFDVSTGYVVCCLCNPTNIVLVLNVKFSWARGIDASQYRNIACYLSLSLNHIVWLHCFFVIDWKPQYVLLRWSTSFQFRFLYSLFGKRLTPFCSQKFILF